MAKPLDPALVAVIKRHFPDLSDQDKKDMCWLLERPTNKGGDVWVMKHQWVERIGAAAGVDVKMMEFISVNHEKGYAACQVMADANGRTVITTGEASPENSKSPYPFAVAEKRAVDRAILKLLGVHGEVFSDEEMEPATKKEEKVVHVSESQHPFSEFWDSYGKKVGSKHKCQSKWLRLKESEKAAIMAHLPAYVDATPDPAFRKNPETYLNGRIWETESLPLQGKSAVKAVGEEMSYRQMLTECDKYMRTTDDYQAVKKEDGRTMWIYVKR